jgi:hypothetical protein
MRLATATAGMLRTLTPVFVPVLVMAREIVPRLGALPFRDVIGVGVDVLTHRISLSSRAIRRIN